MKDKTMAILIWTAVALTAAGLFIDLAVEIFGNSQDTIIQENKKIENY